ncbi:MAG: DUF362 domain-containing protein [Asgard group archaeon]|nr:DUF362 domain-containing protein [Asgard group archaeon]
MLSLNYLAKVIVRDVNFNPDESNYLNKITELTYEILDSLGGKNLLKSSKDVYIKPNGIDTKPYAYTRPEVIEATINYFKDSGANKIYLMENSTQANYTRIVFDVLGYKKICIRTGAKPIYLDEMKTASLEFKGKQESRFDSEGYDKTTFDMPKILIDKLIVNKDENLYVNIPKLKTHSMGVVTLGIKNQWAFPAHFDRKFDHNYNLHYKLIDILNYIQPDITLIEGVEGTINGHYPTEAFHNRVIKPFRVMIASTNVLAADIVGASVFGITPKEVPALRISIEKKICGGIQSIEDIEIDGNLSRFNEKYDFDIIQEFPSNVNIIKGKELLCREGCLNNPLVLVQTLHYDHGGIGKCDLVIGKGHDPEIIDNLEGPVVVAGHCAVNEVGERLIRRLGKKHVFCSDGCNNLAETLVGLGRYMGVNLLKLVPINPIKSIILLLQAKLHGSKANVPSLTSILKPYKIRN